MKNRTLMFLGVILLSSYLTQAVEDDKHSPKPEQRTFHHIQDIFKKMFKGGGGLFGGLLGNNQYGGHGSQYGGVHPHSSNYGGKHNLHGHSGYGRPSYGGHSSIGHGYGQHGLGGLSSNYLKPGYGSVNPIHGYGAQTSQFRPGYGAQTSQFKPGYGAQTSQFRPGYGAQTSQFRPGYGAQTSQFRPGYGAQTSQFRPGYGVQTSQFRPGYGAQTSQFRPGYGASTYYGSAVSPTHSYGAQSGYVPPVYTPVGGHYGQTYGSQYGYLG